MSDKSKIFDINELVILEAVRDADPDIPLSQTTAKEDVSSDTQEQQNIQYNTQEYQAKFVTPCAKKIDFVSGTRITLNKELYKDISKLLTVISSSEISPTVFIHNIISEHMASHREVIMQLFNGKIVKHTKEIKRLFND